MVAVTMATINAAANPMLDNANALQAVHEVGQLLRRRVDERRARSSGMTATEAKAKKPRSSRKKVYPTMPRCGRPSGLAAGARDRQGDQGSSLPSCGLSLAMVAQLIPTKQVKTTQRRERLSTSNGRTSLPESAGALAKRNPGVRLRDAPMRRAK